MVFDELVPRPGFSIRVDSNSQVASREMPSQERIGIVEQRDVRHGVRRPHRSARPKPPPDRDPLPPGGCLPRAHVASPLPYLDEAVRLGQLLRREQVERGVYLGAGRGRSVGWRRGRELVCRMETYSSWTLGYSAFTMCTPRSAAGIRRPRRRSCGRSCSCGPSAAADSAHFGWSGTQLPKAWHRF